MSIKARDVRTNIAANGFERGVVITLESICEDLSALRTNMQDAAELIVGISEQTERFLIIGNGIQAKLDMLERNVRDDEPQG
jgi:hypothetical protein